MLEVEAGFPSAKSRGLKPVARWVLGRNLSARTHNRAVRWCSAEW